MSYISRFILWTGMFSVLLLAGGCRRHTLDGNAEEDYALVDAMFILRCNELETRTATQEEQEKQVNDLNLFFVHKSYPSPAAPEVRHYYFSSVDVAKHLKLTNIRLGKYRMYAVANAGKSLCPETAHDPETPPGTVSDALCSLTENDILNLDAKFSQNPNKIEKFVMVGENPNTEIKRSDSVLPTVQVELKRKVAKYDLSYRLVGQAVGKLIVKRLEMKSVPSYVACFKDNQQVGARYNSWAIQNFGEDGQIFDTPFETSFYLPENMQGEGTNVNKAADRHVKNAPENATYLYVDGEYDKSQYGMSIYLGDEIGDEYSGGNFDIKGNVYYKLNIEQGGPNLEDARISSLKLEIQNNVVEAEPNMWVEMPVKITCANYFNDNLVLNCNVANPSIGEVQGEFEVYKSDAMGGMDDKLTDKGNFRYDVLTTGEDGNGEVWCVVRYRQTEAFDRVKLALTVQSRLGTANFKDQVIDFKN
ncbi:hypothetical protein [uncultured Rikenella sp.]|uniref:DUF4906 domain-containing protein n=1 Tax=uncultured Rikenella sp. TaxID=368003 RepID=UPI00272B4E3A|nr:hypothetical protein [uncultured Rikenella sp.]